MVGIGGQGIVSGWRSVIGIAGKGVVCGHWIAGQAIWDFLGSASSGWRCVFGVAAQGAVWVALCHWDCWAGSRLCGVQGAL